MDTIPDHPPTTQPGVPVEETTFTDTPELRVALRRALVDEPERTLGERELDAVVAITRALSVLPEGSRRKVLGTVEDYVQIPPRRARTAAGAAEGT